jgi:hypothetical protein
LKHFASPGFWQAYARLPHGVQRQADSNFALLKENPRHPSLHLKKVGRFWSVRIGLAHRALAVATEEDLLWFWIGSHSDYDKMIR